MRRIIFILVILLSVCSHSFAQQNFPSASFTISNASICRNDSVKVTYTGYSIPIAKGGPVFFKWNFGGAAKVDSTTPGGPYELHFASPVTSGTITLTVDSSGVTNTFSLPVTILDTISGTISVNNVTGQDSGCFNGDITIAYTNNTGTPAGYTWIFAPGTLVPGSGSAAGAGAPGAISVRYDVTNSTPNQYYPIILKVVDQNGCSSTITQKFFLVNPPQRVNFTATPLNGCLPLNATFVDSTTGGHRYSWSFGDGDTSNVAAPIYTYKVAGAYTVTLRAYGAYNCVDSIVHANYIIVNDTPTGNISIVDTGCFKSVVSIAFSGSTGGSGQYTWNYTPATYVSGNPSGPGTIGIRFDSTNSTPNKYYPISVKVVDKNGCVGHFTQSFFLADVPHHIVFYGTPLVGCAPLTVSFTDTVVGANAYAWSFGDGTTGNSVSPTHIYQYGGKYTVTLRAYGVHECVDSTVYTKYITAYAPPTVNFYTNPLDNTPIELSNATINFYNQTGGAIKYKWWFGDSIITKGDSSYAKDTVHTYTKPGTYIVWLYATDSAGCIDSTEHTIMIIANSEVFIPNTFTPNGDSRNDIWYVYGHDIDKVQMRIYDRWGEEVYSSDDFFAGWDGTFHGKPANTGVYSYIATVYRTNQRVEHYRGGVTLIR